MRYKYEVELDYPDYYIVIYSDIPLKQEEIYDKAIKKMLRKTMLYKVTEIDNKTNKKRSLNEIETDIKI